MRPETEYFYAEPRPRRAIGGWIVLLSAAAVIIAVWVALS